MKKCRGCKFTSEDSLEEYVAHLRTTHGIFLYSLKKTFPRANWEEIERILARQRTTGIEGIGMFKPYLKGKKLKEEIARRAEKAISKQKEDE